MRKLYSLLIEKFKPGLKIFKPGLNRSEVGSTRVAFHWAKRHNCECLSMLVAPLRLGRNSMFAASGNHNQIWKGF